MLSFLFFRRMFASSIFYISVIILSSIVFGVQPTIDPIFANDLDNMVRLFAVALGMRENRESLNNREQLDSDRNPLRVARTQEFLSRCVSDSVIRQSVSATVGIETSDHLFLFGHIAIAEISASQLPHNVLLSMPSDVHEYFIDLLTNNGVTESFLNCTPSALGDIPALNILLEEGVIVLDGSDLFEHDPSTNTCYPRYAISNGMFHIVPELFPGINVLFDYNEVYICDPL